MPPALAVHPDVPNTASVLPESVTLAQIEAAILYQKRRKYYSYFPDEGKFRRELYVKHLAFIEAGKQFDERLFISANRAGKCITAATLISTPRGRVSMRELYDGGAPFKVWAWNGERPVVRQASAPFKKSGLHECYRIKMADNTFSECADHHRVLTHAGYRRLSELLPRFGLSRHPSKMEPSQSIQREDDPHSSETLEDFQAHYSVGSRRYDGPLRSVRDSGPIEIPSRADARRRVYAFRNSDGTVNIYKHIPSQLSDPLSIPYASHHYADQFVESSSRSADTRDGRLRDLSLKQSQYPPVFPLRQFASALQGLECETFACDLPLALLDTSNHIVSVEPIGLHEVYDFEVEEFHNYIAGNLIHHNTDTGAYEITTHAHGEYPSWWPGHHFSGPVEGWIANTNWDTVRDVNQFALLGPPEQEAMWGTGMIPHDKIVDIQKNAHVKNGVMLVKVRYRDSKSECSVFQFKNYEQGRESFQGTNKHLIWGDEEMPRDIYEECLLRLMVWQGRMMLTYTPIQGMTELTMAFLEERENKSRFFITAGWDDAPHLTEDAKRKMAASIAPHLRDARMKGLPSMGSGMVFPISEEAIKCADFPIPSHFDRCAGMDTGWSFTAGVWLARNNDTGVVYLYDCYKGSEERPPIHAEAFKQRGAWIPVSGDCAAINVTDGEQLIRTYRDMGVKVSLPDKRSKNANVQAVWIALQTGKLKVFASCAKWFEEFRLYHRNENGEIVKANDHIMDATQYAFVSGLLMAITHAPEHTDTRERPRGASDSRNILGGKWMG